MGLGAGVENPAHSASAVRLTCEASDLAVSRDFASRNLFDERDDFEGELRHLDRFSWA